MLVGRTPFEAKFPKQTYRKMLNQQYILPKFVSEEAQDLIKGILKVKVEERMTIEDVLAHPFLQAEDKEPESIDKKLESGDLITLGQPADDFNMFLNPLPVEESCPKKTEKIISPEPQMIPEKQVLEVESKPQKEVNQVKEVSKGKEVQSKKKSKKVKKSSTSDNKANSKRSHSARGRRFQSRISQLRKASNSTCEVIKEADNEDEEESFAIDKLKQLKNERQALSNQNLMFTRNALQFGKENNAPNTYNNSGFGSDKRSNKLSRVDKNNQEISQGVQLKKPSLALEDINGYGNMKTQLFEGKDSRNREMRRYETETQQRDTKELTQASGKTRVSTQGLTSFKHQTKNFSFDLGKDGCIRIYIFKKQRTIIISQDGDSVTLSYDSAMRRDKIYPFARLPQKLEPYYDYARQIVQVLRQRKERQI